MWIKSGYGSKHLLSVAKMLKYAALISLLPSTAEVERVFSCFKVPRTN